MLNAAFALPEPPVTVVGGSLVARNEALLLERYPNLLVARADGEATIEGLLAHWHGDVAKEDIPALGYNGAARGGGLAITRRRTAKPVARHAAGDILPELDLLPATFERHGVAQLEASRGCTNFCSFCPRGRKGTRFGAPADRLPWILGEVRKVFDLCPDVSRTLYLVDEEFIGRGCNAVSRAVDIVRVLHEAGFAWGSSCRVDRVVHLAHDDAWHIERVTMWRTLVKRGLRRMLFGVESGVESILARFNKETTSEQNALTIRTPSALGVPTRFADWRIGVASDWAQRWVDRNFALDYTLKSLEKVLDGDPRAAVRGARVVLKDAAYTVLGDMIAAIGKYPLDGSSDDELELTASIGVLLEGHVKNLRGRMGTTVHQVSSSLHGEHAFMLHRAHDRWSHTSGWRLINASDPAEREEDLRGPRRVSRTRPKVSRIGAGC